MSASPAAPLRARVFGLCLPLLLVGDAFPSCGSRNRPPPPPPETTTAPAPAPQGDAAP